MQFPDLFDLFDHVYIVNLPNRDDRRSETIAEFAQLGLSIPSSAISFFEASRPKDKDTFPTVGTLGLFLTNIRLLKHALESGHKRILVIEDDVTFPPVGPDALKSIVSELSKEDWDIAALGYNQPGPPPFDTPGIHAWSEGVVGSQMWAIQGPAMQRFCDYLQLARSRPLGHPLGGAMHFDASFFMVRVEHPDFRFHIASPCIADQRASRTDIHDLQFFDRVEPFRSIVAQMRKIKNRLR